MNYRLQYLRPDSHCLDDHPRLPKIFEEATNGINQIRRKLGLEPMEFRHDHVEIVPGYNWEKFERSHGMKDTLGFHVMQIPKSFVRNHMDPHFRHIGQFERGIRETGKVMTHELIHHGSGNGLTLLMTLDEGITETNTDEIFASRVHSVVSGATTFYGETNGREVWNILHESCPRASEDIHQAFWEGDNAKAATALINGFGRRVLSLLLQKKIVSSTELKCALRQS